MIRIFYHNDNFLSNASVKDELLVILDAWMIIFQRIKINLLDSQL